MKLNHQKKTRNGEPCAVVGAVDEFTAAGPLLTPVYA